MFIRALRRDQIEFVNLFLDHDFSLMDVFDNTNVLRSLYDDINIGVSTIQRSSQSRSSDILVDKSD